MRSQAIVDAIALSPGFDPRVQWPFREFAQRTGGKVVGAWGDLSRTGLGTRVDASDVVGYGPHNLLRWSEDFSNAAWQVNGGASKTPNYAAAPDGTTTACRVVLPSGANIYAADLAAGTKTRGFWARTVDGSTQTVNTPNGLTTTVEITGTWALYSNTTDGGSAWDFQLQGGASAAEILLWHPQTCAGTALTAYVPTTATARYLPRVQYRSGTARGLLIEGQATQLLGRTEDFSNAAAWGRAGASVSTNTVVAPDGSANAETLTGTSSTNCVIFENAGISLSAGQTTWSVYLKRGTADFAVVSLWSGSGTNGVNAWINLQTKQLSTSAATAGYLFTACQIDILPNDWMRVSLTGSVPAATCFVSVRMVDASGGFVYTDTVGKTLHIWGAQLEAGPVATSYIPNSGTGTVVRAADSAGVFLTSTALSAAFPGGVGQPWTTVFQYRKGYSVSSDETLFALSAGSSAGSTNLLALQVNGTQAQAVHSGGSGTLSGTLVHDGSTINKIALSVDPAYIASTPLNATFDADISGWAAQFTSTASWQSGALRSVSSGTNAGEVSRSITCVVGRTYRVTGTVLGGTSSGRITASNVAYGGSGSSFVGSGGVSFSFVATATTMYIVCGLGSGSAGAYCDFDDILVVEAGRMSISVNGGAAVETTGIAFTGSGTTHLIPGARTTSGSTPVAAMEIADWRNVNTAYTTGSALQALSA